MNQETSTARIRRSTVEMANASVEDGRGIAEDTFEASANITFQPRRTRTDRKQHYAGKPKMRVTCSHLHEPLRDASHTVQTRLIRPCRDHDGTRCRQRGRDHDSITRRSVEDDEIVVTRNVGEFSLKHVSQVSGASLRPTRHHRCKVPKRWPAGNYVQTIANPDQERKGRPRNQGRQKLLPRIWLVTQISGDISLLIQIDNEHPATGRSCKSGHIAHETRLPDAALTLCDRDGSIH
ncbi:hypothetical protein J2X85_001636 [Microbacterium trichothecenolyticum]|nr:hypothetical protein [Microbacterium trichothecenolyticum]